jgi:hypothetical protein
MVGPEVLLGRAVMPGRLDQQTTHMGLPALVIDPCTRELPEVYSHGTSPAWAPIEDPSWGPPSRSTFRAIAGPIGAAGSRGAPAAIVGSVCIGK